MFFDFFFRKVNGEFVLHASLCCCVFRAVAGGVLAVVGGWLVFVPIMMSFAVDAACGESVRNMSVLRGLKVRGCCDRCTCRCRPRLPLGGGCR